MLSIQAAWMSRSATPNNARRRCRAPGLRSALSGLLSGLLMASAPAHADFVASLYGDWLTPRAADFAQASAALVAAVTSACAAPEGLEAARTSWKQTLVAWETLAGVGLGSVLERRSQRAIDFTPTRPRMIEKAIQSAPKSPADMELIGTPAKGLPALEWLLWVKPVQPGTPACTYAIRVAEDLHREADAIAAAQVTPTEPQGMLTELVNQWVGGIERLRWPGMEMPVRVALTSAQPIQPDFTRRESGAADLAWAAQWRALKHLAVTGPGSMHGALQARGQTVAVEALYDAVSEADGVMSGLARGDWERILVAAKRLAALKHQVETVVAPALGVSIGFSDADGD